MIKKAQFLGVLLVVILGLLSLLATVPSTDSLLIYTVNDRDGDSVNQLFYACLEEKIMLRWVLAVSGSALLNSTPADAFSLSLENKTIRNDGEMNVTFLKPVKLTVKFSETSRDYMINELPEDICTGFPFAPVIGEYVGTLTQTSPQPASLESNLQFIWKGDKLNARVDFRAAFPCTFDALTDQITCTEGDEAAPTFRLEGQFVEETYQGNYQGIGETAGVQTNFQGTFNFKKAVIPAQ
jgi:hypothetical protein